MVETKFHKYIHMYKDKNDFISKINEYNKCTLDERKALANSCFKITSKQSYANKLEKVLENAIKKYKDINKNMFTFF